MYYVLTNKKSEKIIATSSSVAGYKSKGYWIAAIGTYQECQEFDIN